MMAFYGLTRRGTSCGAALVVLAIITALGAGIWFAR